MKLSFAVIISYCFLQAITSIDQNVSLINFHPPHFHLHEVVIGKSVTVDYKGDNYNYAVFNKKVDRYVSDVMLHNQGVWEPFLNSLLSYLLSINKDYNPNGVNENIVVIDAGANLGSFTLYAGSLGLVVWAFEMQQIVYSLLDISIRLSGYQKHIHLYNLPLWNSTKEITYSEGKNNFGGAYIHKGANNGEKRATTMRLDNIITNKKIFFMKVDVEGVEEYVLSGFDTFINNNKVQHISIGDSGAFHLPIYYWLYKQNYTCRNFGPAESNNKHYIGCDKHTTNTLLPTYCVWNSYNDIMNDMNSLTAGHFNVLCTLTTVK